MPRGLPRSILRLGGPVATYDLRLRLPVPPAFAYRWCTDYRPEDGRRSGEHYERRILARSARSISFEDVEPEKEGWAWRRTVVTLDPPHHWHAESFGNVRHFSMDYSLSPRNDGTTELRFLGRRQATALRGRNPPRAEMERYLRGLWTTLGRSMARDYRASRRRRSRRRS